MYIDKNKRADYFDSFWRYPIKKSCEKLLDNILGLTMIDLLNKIYFRMLVAIIVCFSLCIDVLVLT